MCCLSCPLGSVHIVSDLKSGKGNKAIFWFSSFMGRFAIIEYTALCGSDNECIGGYGSYTDIRKLEGDQRLLSYTDK